MHECSVRSMWCQMIYQNFAINQNIELVWQNTFCVAGSRDYGLMNYTYQWGQRELAPRSGSQTAIMTRHWILVVTQQTAEQTVFYYSNKSSIFLACVQIQEAKHWIGVQQFDRNACSHIPLGIAEQIAPLVISCFWALCCPFTTGLVWTAEPLPMCPAAVYT